MRIATFNTMHGATLPTVGRPVAAQASAQTTDLTAAITAALGQVEVLALQEVDSGQPRSGYDSQVPAVARALDAAHWRFRPALAGTPNGGADWTPATAAQLQAANTAAGSPDPLYGIGLVSRLPVRQWHSAGLPAHATPLPLLVSTGPRRRLQIIHDEPRAVLAAVVTGARGPITVVTTHLSFVPGVNVGQLRRIRDWVADLPRPLLLLGDLNLPVAVAARVTGWQPLVRARTFPSWAPRVQLDHVLADGLTPEQVSSVRIERHRLPVSDHCALAVSVDL